MYRIRQLFYFILNSEARIMFRDFNAVVIIRNLYYIRGGFDGKER